LMNLVSFKDRLYGQLNTPKINHKTNVLKDNSIIYMIGRWGKRR